MGPGPNDADIPVDAGGDRCGNSDDEYERDGWRIGFAVEMNGVGVANYGNASSEDESSAESDAVSELGADSRYIGYEAIPNGPDSAVHESECWTTFNIPPSIQRQFEQAFSDSSNVHMKDSDFAIEHHPQPIDLDEEKVAYIKSAMSSFTLPAPSWAAGMQTDEELRRIFERISSKK